MKKKRVKVFFTLDPEVSSEFEKVINEKLLDKSKLLEHLIVEFIKNNK